MEEEKWPINYALDKDLSIRDKCTLAVGSVLRLMNDDFVDTLWSRCTDHSIKDCLSNSWGITDYESSIGTLEWLKTDGHRVEYNPVLEIIKKLPVNQREEAISNYSSKNMYADNQNSQNETLNTYQYLKCVAEKMSSLTTTKVEFPANIASWDYGRMVNVACWCGEVGYITLDETLHYIYHAYDESKKVYSSWREFGMAYLFGRIAWDLDRADHDDTSDIINKLLSDNRSPWVRLPFKRKMSFW